MTTLPLKSIRAGLSLIFTVFHPKLELLNLLRVIFISGSNESCGPYPCQNDHAFACDSDSRKPPQQASQGHMYPEMKVSSLIDLQQPLAFPSVLGQRSCWPRVCESSPKGQGNYPSLHSLQGATERRTCYLYSHRRLIPPPLQPPFHGICLKRCPFLFCLQNQRASYRTWAPEGLPPCPSPYQLSPSLNLLLLRGPPPRVPRLLSQAPPVLGPHSQVPLSCKALLGSAPGAGEKNEDTRVESYQASEASFKQT